MKSGWILLSIVAIVYAYLYSTDMAHFHLATVEVLKVLKIIIPILVFVAVIIFVIEYFFDDEKLKKHLGRDRGIKAWLIALVGGILSHGPSYIWYPMLQTLREKGVRDSLVIVFLYARSIKIPWIPMMVVYFGWKFTFLFIFYIIVGALVQGVIVEVITRSKSVTSPSSRS